jgi:hypothetical protein
MKVYVVTLFEPSGPNEVLTIVGVYSSKDNAEKQGEHEVIKFKALHGGSDIDFEVMEYEVI